MIYFAIHLMVIYAGLFGVRLVKSMLEKEKCSRWVSSFIICSLAIGLVHPAISLLISALALPTTFLAPLQAGELFSLSDLQLKLLLIGLGPAGSIAITFEAFRSFSRKQTLSKRDGLEVVLIGCLSIIGWILWSCWFTGIREEIGELIL